MSHDEPQIYCIHPITENLRFLLRLIKRFRKKYPTRFKYLKLLNNDSSHTRCLNLLSSIRDGLFIFLCHGYTECILGCDFRSSTLDLTERFKYGPFINDSTFSALTGNKIIAFCCNSNGVAEAAVKAGAKVAIGFESIRFDYQENIERGVKFKKIQQTVKYEIRCFLYDSIVYAIDRKLSFDDLVKHMRLLLNKRYKQILCSGHKHNQEIAAILLEIKMGIKLFGDPNLSVLS